MRERRRAAFDDGDAELRRLIREEFQFGHLRRETGGRRWAVSAARLSDPRRAPLMRLRGRILDTKLGTFPLATVASRKVFAQLKRIPNP